MTYRFGSPMYLLLFILLAGAIWMIYRRTRRSALLFPVTHRFPKNQKSWRKFLLICMPPLFIIATALHIIALARPQTLLASIKSKTNAISIMMVTDISGSMEALDLSIKTAVGVKERTRLDAVKEVFTEFVEKRPDDLIGLVVFGGYASTKVPLTSDHNLLTHVIKGTEIPKQVIDEKGRIINQEELLTAIGDGVATACARLEKAPTKSKIVVLLSDGESNTGIIKPEEATELAKKMGIKIYTIGIGSTGKAPFRTKDIFGRETVGWADVVLDEKLLKSMAEQTGGVYYNVKDNEGLKGAMNSINKLERTEITRHEYKQYKENFAWFLIPGMFLLTIASTTNMVLIKRIV